MTRKLTPQEHLENIIIQQNEGRPVNQYTALLYNPGIKKFERRDGVIEFGSSDDCNSISAIGFLLMFLVAPLVVPIWLIVSWAIGSLIGYRNNASPTRTVYYECFEEDLEVLVGTIFLGILVHLFVLGFLLGLILGNSFLNTNMLIANLIGASFAVIAETANVRASLKYLATMD